MDKIVVDSLEGLPETLAPLKSLFKEVDGKFEYTPPKSEDTSGLKSAKAKAEREAKELKAQFEELKQRLVVDGEEVTAETLQELLELRTKAKEQEGKQLIPKADLDRLIKEATAAEGGKHKKTIETLQGENKTLAQTLDRVLINDGLRSAGARPDLPFRLKPGSIEFLIKAARADGVFKVVDGKAVVMNGDGPKMGANDQPMGPTEWLTEQVTANPFLAEESEGSGAKKNGGPINAKQKRSEMTVPQKSAFIEKHGHEAYSQLPA